jgi:DNA-binding transcriptional ArsR family regulator
VVVVHPEGTMDWTTSDEAIFRASRLCRVLGNPKTYEIVRTLAEEGEASPSDLTHSLARSYSTICIHLRHLREIDVVRSRKERKGNRTLYSLAASGIEDILAAVEGFTGAEPWAKKTAAPAGKRKKGKTSKKGGRSSRAKKKPVRAVKKGTSAKTKKTKKKLLRKGKS